MARRDHVGIRLDQDGEFHPPAGGSEMRVAAAAMENSKKQNPAWKEAGVLSRDAMIALNWFMRSLLKNAASTLYGDALWTWPKRSRAGLSPVRNI